MWSAVGELTVSRGRRQTGVDDDFDQTLSTDLRDIHANHFTGTDLVTPPDTLKRRECLPSTTQWQVKLVTFVIHPIATHMCHAWGSEGKTACAHHHAFPWLEKQGKKCPTPATGKASRPR
ncbi:hypothetical protein TSMEX_011554 [Taenia solium]|eukprot:TsM_000170200 transcript=TsM_000170200 gene=TsM_000170200